MTGHSFGAALGLVASIRFASKFSMLRLFCHIFGCPKIAYVSGQLRNSAHSLSNLKIIRVEYATDPFVHLPEGSKWVHIGHSIRVSSTGYSKPPNAFKFDRYRPNPNLVKQFLRSSPLGKKHKQSNNHNIQSYISALQNITTRKIPWVKTYVGEEGKGCKGKNDEKRLLV